MNVEFIVLSGHSFRQEFNSPKDAMVTASKCGTYDRIAFGGRTKLGRSGIAFNLQNHQVTGHKIEPIPSELIPLLHHVSIKDTYYAFELLSKGEDILMGDSDHGIALKWCGTQLEVFGAGDDSL